jgi:hypothetical protein
MKYKIQSYDDQTAVVNVKIAGDSENIDAAQSFSIALATLASVSDFNKAVFEIFTSYQAAQQAKANLSFDLVQYVQSANNVVVPLTLGVNGVVQGANSTAVDSGNVTPVQVL